MTGWAGGGPITRSELRRLLDTYGLRPRRRAGQHFLVEPTTAARIISDAGIAPEDRVVEIGPGVGSLTRGLVTVAREVIAVEIDAGLVRLLTDTLGDLPQLRIVHADATAVDLDALAGGPFRVVANLPYHLATALVLRMLDCRHVTDLFVMVQREVGWRWTARPGSPHYGAVSVKLALRADVELVRPIPPQVFHPVPKVESVTVRLRPRPPDPDRDRITAVVEAAFAQRRKTLRNALASRFGRLSAERALAAAHIPPQARAETLSLEDFRRLAHALDVGDPSASQ